MRERIMRLSRGIVDAETPKLFLEPAKVEETLGSDTVYKRELYLASENNLYIKGLAYSSHSRVRILKSAFGGLRNHIVYEVDTSWCENGDLIRGNFTLVTNSGELEVPFLFRVEMIESVRVLSTLKTMEDFVELAKRDMDLALRLMEYRDFTEAPFFKDLKIRTIYEGLKGHGNRQNALEEFFLAAGVKEPIELTLSTAKKESSGRTPGDISIWKSVLTVISSRSRKKSSLRRILRMTVWISASGSIRSGCTAERTWVRSVFSRSTEIR